MLDSTLRQKFIYNTPFSDDEMPYVVLNNLSEKPHIVPLTSLYTLEEKDYIKFAETLNDANTTEILLKNDLVLSSNSPIIKKALKCYLLSFAYHFQKLGFKTNIQL